MLEQHDDHKQTQEELPPSPRLEVNPRAKLCCHRYKRSDSLDAFLGSPSLLHLSAIRGWIMAANVPSQWDLIYMMGLVSACERTQAFVFCKKESDGMQIYLAATENWFVDTPTAAELQGGRIKSLLSPSASTHSVRWASNSYCSTNVAPAGRNAHWSWTKWQQSAGEKLGLEFGFPVLLELCLSTAVLSGASSNFTQLDISHHICTYSFSLFDIVALSDRGKKLHSPVCYTYNLQTGSKCNR